MNLFEELYGVEKFRIKSKHFIWLVNQDRILNNVLRTIKWLTDHATCERCLLADETACHVLRDCSKAKKVWDSMDMRPSPSINQALDIRECLGENLKNDSSFNGEGTWYVFFCSTIWHIWKSRNNEVLAGMTSEPYFIAAQSRKLAYEIGVAFGLFGDSVRTPDCDIKYIKWSFPCTGHIKIKHRR